MIKNELDLATTQERIMYFERLLTQLRVVARPEEFPTVASGYRAELETMQKDVLDFLTQHASEMAPRVPSRENCADAR